MITVKRTFALILMICMIFLCGCDAYQEPYKEAGSAFAHADFEAARTLLANIPPDYMETQLYLDAFAVIDGFESGNWLDATRGCNAIHRRWTLHYDKEKLFAGGFQPITYVYSLMDKIAETQAGHPLNFKISTSGGRRYQSGFEKFGVDMMLFAPYLYYQEQYEQGKDLGELEAYPLTKGTLHLKDWAKYRSEQLASALKEDAQFAEYLALTDDSISPTPVDGNGLYLHMENNFPVHAFYADTREHSPINIDLDGILSPFYLAGRPDQIRYVLSIVQNYIQYGTYTDNSVAYQIDGQVTLKDTKTGRILMAKTYTAKPETKVVQKDKRTGILDYGPESTAFKRDILPALKKIYPLLRDQAPQQGDQQSE